MVGPMGENNKFIHQNVKYQNVTGYDSRFYIAKH
jgi:hypothetical protein